MSHDIMRNDTIALRIKFAALFFFAAFGYLAWFLYGLQVERHDELYTKAKDQYTSVKTLEGRRGAIFDSAGNLLAGNSPCMDICADPQIVGDAEKCAEIAKFFSKALNLNHNLIYNRLARKTRPRKLPDGGTEEVPVNYAIIADKVDLALADKLKDEVTRRKYKGIVFRSSFKRYYPKNEMLANIIGFTNIDHDQVIAVIGIEKFFQKAISPVDSKIKYERARDGLPLSYGNQERLNDIKNGFNIYLTIKEPLQVILEEELQKLMDEFNPRAAYAVMADPRTGDILAVAQRPTFNPNERDSMNPDAWRCRISEDIFEPGSTMKPFAVSGALDNGVVTPNTHFDCEGGKWFYGGKLLRDSHPLGNLTVSEIIQKSSNIGTAKISLALGEKRLYETMKAFGFGEKTGVELSPETSGIFRPLKKWDTLSITRFPIGQGMAASPMQLLRGYCILANGGIPVRLRLVDRIENPDTGIIIKPPVELGERIFKRDSTAREIVEMMKLVTQKGGTAEKAAVKGYYVAGKTGTSQKFVGGNYSSSAYFSTFVGFAPADRPAFALLVTADEPKKAHYGGTVSGPTFSRIAERAFRYLNVLPDYIPEPPANSKVAKK